MDQEQVNIASIETHEGFVHSVSLFIKTGPEFGLQKDIFPFKARFLDGAPHRLFVYVSVCRIDKAIPALQCAGHRGFCLIRSQQKSTNACHRHVDSIV